MAFTYATPYLENLLASTMAAEGSLAYPPRKWYRRVPFVPDRSSKTLLDDGGNRRLTPEVNTNIFKRLVFSWLDELIALGYSRPFSKDELYLLPESSDASRFSEELDRNVARLKDGVTPGKKRFQSPTWRLARAINATIFQWFWIGGIIKLLADSSTICSPLLVRAIIKFLQKSEDRRDAGLSEPSLGQGMGLAIGLAALLAFGVLANVHGFYRGYTSGILVRGALIDSLFRRTVNFSPLERTKNNLESSRVVSMISTDVSRIDFGLGYFHSTWTSTIQILICLGLTVSSLGPSALVGFAFIAVLVPTQSTIAKHLFALRKRSMPFTDARLSAINQALGAIRLVKTYAWEEALLAKIGKLRVDELRLLRDRLLWRALNVALSFSVPTLAAVVTFVTYASLGHALDAAEIFASLTFFMLLRTPLQLLPVALGAQSDAANAIQRLSHAFDAPEPGDSLPIDETLQHALELEAANFSYRVNDLDAMNEKAQQDEKKAFCLRDFNLRVRRGELLIVVGPVGSGKSTLLGSLVGETCLEGGRAVLGSEHAYAPQTAWLRSASIRDNIIFGREWDSKRYQEVLEACCLNQDLAILPEGDRTVIGEKGTSLSGGQRQRVALARTIYQPRQLLLLDDVFSALDAHVQALVFEKVVLGRNPGTALVLVTHSLHLLRHADRICCLSGGQIAELGTFSELMNKPDGAMKRLVEEFASKSVTDETKPNANTEPAESSGKAIMQAEERFVGSVTMRTYSQYIRRGKPYFTLTLWVVSIFIFQGGSILSPLWLQWWQEDRYANVSTGAYMGIYAALGISQALGLLFMSGAFGFFTFYSASHLHADAIRSVLYAPIAFFDTTPLGRILARFSKDTDTIDNVIGEALRMFLSTTAQVVGAVVLIAILLPWFLLAVAFVVVMFVFTGMYYRPAARELRRLDALLRSPIYEHATESLAGIMVIRSLGALKTTIDRNTQNINRENSAYWLSVACQRWFSVRLDLLGVCLVLLVGIIVVASRGSISAAQGGVALSYIVTVQSVFGYMIRQSAEIEQNMNAIERLLYYSDSVPQEPPHRRSGDQELTEKQWPSQGAIEYEALVFAHRSDLTPSLRGVSVTIPAGSRVAFVGRTGSGKSTMLAALTGMGDVVSGRISIDGIDTTNIGLKLLRDKIAFMPQEAAVLSGTLRYNLDPFGEHDDADLWRVVHQVRLSAMTASDSESSKENLTVVDEKDVDSSRHSHHLDLDTPISAEGANLSSGQRSLISLARALVKNAAIFVLDEATASMDAELDHRVQQILRANLQGKTTIVVAHRLDSVIGSSDFICVMDEGKVAQFGPPLDLYREAGSIFHTLCTNAGISVDDIMAAHARFH
ncbi:Multidrug resistance protein fer6, partial [Pseudocercospora fuligena]